MLNKIINAPNRWYIMTCAATFKEVAKYWTFEIMHAVEMIGYACMAPVNRYVLMTDHVYTSCIPISHKHLIY